MLARVRPYDPADSPGPIDSVIERFRRRRDRPEPPSGPGVEVARYTVVLIPPDAAEALGYGREEAGLKLYHDDDWDADVGCLDDAARYIAEDCGMPVTLVERRADLHYWTALPADGG